MLSAALETSSILSSGVVTPIITPTTNLFLFRQSQRHGLSSSWAKRHAVAKMASHAIFQYNVLAIDDTHNIWTNMIVKINIPRLLGSSDDKEKIGVARPEGPPLRGF